MNIAYFRVSKRNETIQDLEPQINAVMEKFNLDKKTTIIFKERESAYNLKKLKNRHEFLKLLNLVFDYETTTIKDIFLRTNKKKECNIYVWGFERISRNFEFSLLFSLLADLFHVRVFSYKEGEIKKRDNEKALEKMLRYFQQSITAFSGEKYSEEISDNTKKSVTKDKGVTISVKLRKKWGAKFCNTNGDPIDLETETIESINKTIKKLSKNYKQRYIIDKISKDYGVKISKSYISKQKYLNT